MPFILLCFAVFFWFALATIIVSLTGCGPRTVPIKYNDDTIEVEETELFNALVLSNNLLSDRILELEKKK